MSKPNCECIVDCGDDPWIAQDKCIPCAAYRRGLKRREIDVRQWQDCAKYILEEPRIDQIRRAHASARPTERNPAWLHTSRDLDYVLRVLERFARGEIAG
jgi:hypothetical protein